jgi:4-amino-4-deoxy-L-arabinose transferase-like glycosyltransferase
MHLVDTITGHTLVGLRALGALLCAVGIVSGALIARELGGDRRAQILAAAVCALTPTLRGPSQLVGTTTFDYAVWCVLLLLYARLLRTGAPRWWVAIGLVAGIGLETKWTVLVLLAGMAVGVLVDRRWDLLRSGWLALGIALALVLWAPNLLWNAQHDWAALEFNANIRDENSGLGGRIEFVYGQLLISGIVTLIVWWPGLRWLLAARDERRWMRPIAVTALAVVGLLFVSGGKFYYAAPVYIALLAAGSVVIAAEPRRMRTALAVVTAGAVISLPLTIPVLPASALGLVIPVQKELGEMVGWPEYVAQVRGVVDGLPAEQQARTAVVTGTYAEAAFLERDAPGLRTFSGHNSYWWWGPPPDDATAAVLVGQREAVARQVCADPRVVTRITNDAGIDNDEEGRPVWVCDRLTAPWSQLWPALRRYS